MSNDRELRDPVEVSERLKQEAESREVDTDEWEYCRALYNAYEVMVERGAIRQKQLEEIAAARLENGDTNDDLQNIREELTRDPPVEEYPCNHPRHFYEKLKDEATSESRQNHRNRRDRRKRYSQRRP